MEDKIILGQEDYNLEEKVIDLDYERYEKLLKVLNSDQKNLYFRCGGTEDLINITNVNNQKSNNTSNEKNIVQKWMEDIREIAERGYQEANDTDSERHFSKIKSYCKAVIVSVTS